MRYVAAYCLVSLGGNTDPKVTDIKEVLAAGGIDGVDDQIEHVVSVLKGKSLSQVIAQGKAMLACVPAAGGAPSTSTASTAVAADTQPAAKQNEPKEESDDDMGFGLFD
ncbi:unnamed protein product [Caenorhabditis brenneri]